jgi:membrane-associated phospholipid phosphatase
MKLAFLVYPLVIFLYQFPIQLSAQPDSTQYNQYAISPLKWKSVIGAPLVLAGLGTMSIIDNDLLYRKDLKDQRNRWMPYFRTHVDDYLQYAPIAGVAALNIIGVKGKHTIINQAALLIKSELVMAAIVFPLKKLTAVPRPDTGAANSFPSGHTAQAFVAATFLHKEYGKERPWVSVLGYSTATGIGFLRVLNNRHWISDVLVGAGIGIFATNLIYLTHQNKWGNKHRKQSEIILLPCYAQQTFSMAAIISIR